MDIRAVTPILNVSSVEESIAWFEALGWHRGFTWPKGAAEAGFAGLGYEVSHPPTDKPWGVREFHLRHPDGHTFRVSATSA